MSDPSQGHQDDWLEECRDNIRLREEVARLRAALARAPCERPVDVRRRVRGLNVDTHITYGQDCGECDSCKAREEGGADV